MGAVVSFKDLDDIAIKLSEPGEELVKLGEQKEFSKTIMLQCASSLLRNVMDKNKYVEEHISEFILEDTMTELGHHVCRSKLVKCVEHGETDLVLYGYPIYNKDDIQIGTRPLSIYDK